LLIITNFRGNEAQIRQKTDIWWKDC